MEDPPGLGEIRRKTKELISIAKNPKAIMAKFRMGMARTRRILEEMRDPVRITDYWGFPFDPGIAGCAGAGGQTAPTGKVSGDTTSDSFPCGRRKSTDSNLQLVPIKDQGDEVPPIGDKDGDSEEGSQHNSVVGDLGASMDRQKMVVGEQQFASVHAYPCDTDVENMEEVQQLGMDLNLSQSDMGCPRKKAWICKTQPGDPPDRGEKISAVLQGKKTAGGCNVQQQGVIQKISAVLQGKDFEARSQSSKAATHHAWNKPAELELPGPRAAPDISGVGVLSAHVQA